MYRKSRQETPPRSPIEDLYESTANILHAEQSEGPDAESIISQYQESLHGALDLLFTTDELHELERHAHREWLEVGLENAKFDDPLPRLRRKIRGAAFSILGRFIAIKPPANEAELDVRLKTWSRLVDILQDELTHNGKAFSSNDPDDEDDREGEEWKYI